MLANVSDSVPIASLVRDPTGKSFGDTVDIRKKLADTPLRQETGANDQGMQKMKSRSVTLIDKMLLNGRNMAKTVIGNTKAFSSLKLPGCGSPADVLIQLTDYQLKPSQTHNHLKITAL